MTLKMPSTVPLTSEKLSRLSFNLHGEDSISVLLVEDSRTVRLHLRQYITLLDNVELLEAETLAAAHTILQAESATLFCVVLDLTLPDASGLEVVNAVRAYGVPIIVLTGSADPFLRQAVLDMQVIDYMFKNGLNAIEDVAYLIGRLRQNQSMKVMVVDDSKTFHLHVCRYLRQYRFQVISAYNGQEALDILKDNPDIALVLTDYFMPVMNGLDMVRQIRRQHRREDLAIIAFSDLKHPELSATMLKAGANDFLSKDFQIEQFYCRVVQSINMVHFVRELHDMANRDYLTRLHNRRYLFQAMESLHAEAVAGKRTLAVAMVDADRFKRINDEYGHAAGDEALKKIAFVLRRQLSRHDIVARYGGEEFVCVATIKSCDEAAALFESVRAAIEAIDLNWNGITIPLTVSLGVTTAPGISFPDMVERADEAVFRAKAGGRNRVEMATACA
jgi:diguanylate cyclase (GGDEF)-like protein